MIIFTPLAYIDPQLLEMKGIKRVVRYNLSSYITGVPILNELIPSSLTIPEEVVTGDISTPEFDILYHNSILQNDSSFVQFMNIIVEEYMYPDTLVQILIDVSPYRDAVMESLIKLIQQRYGYNPCIIYCLDDFVHAEDTDPSIPGLFTLDQDLNRWRAIVGAQ